MALMCVTRFNSGRLDCHQNEALRRERRRASFLNSGHLFAELISIRTDVEAEWLAKITVAPDWPFPLPWPCRHALLLNRLTGYQTSSDTEGGLVTAWKGGPSSPNSH